MADPPTGPAPPPASRRRPAAAGFTMVMLVVIVAIMAIFMTVAIQLVSFSVRRDKEAELIFRGGQYVEAIRLYRTRYGRYPMTMKEIWEADPKVIRKKWKDPITDSDTWAVVLLGQEGQVITPGGTPTPAPEATPTPTPGMGSGGQTETVGPIVGVHSTSCETSIKVYEGRNRYCDWKFVFRDQPQRGGGGPHQGGSGQKPPGGGKD